MRTPHRSGTQGHKRSLTMSFAPPVGGLNARDSLAQMPETDAITLDNWFPRSTAVEVRRGYSSFATFTGLCESLLDYNGNTSSKLFAAVKNGTTYSIFDATAGGALSTAVVGGAGATVQALTSARFDHANYGTTGGQFMVLVNGLDTPLQYDGSTWSASTMTGTTTANLFTVGVYAERLWFAQKNSFDVWYLDVRSITGTLTRLNLGSLFKLGGYLSNIITVTDATTDLADYICFVSSEGEVIAYAGTDPSSATTWAKAAHFRTGRPVCSGNRAWCKVGADALIVTADGVVSLRLAIATDRAENLQSVSDKIRLLINDAVQKHGNRFGWSLSLHPTGQKLICNVPTAEGEAAIQYVMNSETKAWCRFTGWNAFSWCIARDNAYFGGDGLLAQADYTNSDGSSAITGDVKQAFSYFGAPGRTKQIHMMRPILALDGPCQFGMSLDSDYADGDAPALTTLSGDTDDPWGGIWSVAWSQALALYRAWFTVSGEGFALAPRIRSVTEDTQLSWSATDTVLDGGGGL